MPVIISDYLAIKRMRWLPDPPYALVYINDETAMAQRMQYTSQDKSG